MDQLENFHVLEVKYLGATNTKGSRVKIYSHRFKQSVITDYDYSFSNSYEIAQNWLNKNSFKLIGKGEGKDCYFIFSETFKPLK